MRMTKIKTLDELFIYEFSDMLNAEKQLTKALPKMAESATHFALADSFREHLAETENHVARLENISEIYDLKIHNEKCEAMKGLIEEAEQVMDEVEKGPVLDAALIAAAQKVEHYEIATYGTLCELARQLGYIEAVSIMQETLNEEKTCDQKLTTLAEGSVNDKAQQESAA